MTGGYTGKILRIDLTSKSISTLDTEKYEEFGGGYGMGTAIFWDLAVAPGEWDLKDPYDPRNVLPIMVGPLATTGVPAAARTSICGISPETYPTHEFWRGNFGGRFGTMMKLAGLHTNSILVKLIVCYVEKTSIVSINLSTCRLSLFKMEKP